jgi:tol-pal system protein YbgF
VRRVEQLEEQFVDLQIIVGTLDSLARNGGGAPPLPAGTGGRSAGVGMPGEDTGRIAALETQVRALTAQIEQLSDQVRAMSGGGAVAAAARPGGFGATTVTPGGGDPIGEMLSTEPQGDAAESTPLDAPAAGNPKQLYERAYGLLMQHNYPAAESSFDEFLKRYPNDELAANAQYWLGETYFVQGQYKAAAGAFLKSSRSYPRSAKGPDSMLKLAMSLDRLGQRDAACQAYSELGVRYPSPPAHVRDRVQSERQRVGCR